VICEKHEKQKISLGVIWYFTHQSVDRSYGCEEKTPVVNLTDSRSGELICPLFFKIKK